MSNSNGGVRNAVRRGLSTFNAAMKSCSDGGLAGVNEFRRRYLGKPVATVEDPLEHARRALEWICRAQDSQTDGGVSWGYDLVGGWKRSYPETTGYIIPTFYDFESHFPTLGLADRAKRMAHWESDVQMESGAVMAGSVERRPLETAMFNTGQVLFGWVRALEETGEGRFAESATRAGQWMLDHQDDDGAWRRGLSPAASLKGPRAYNVRSAWGLLLAGLALDRKDFVDGALKAALWTVSQQSPNGWIDCCCLTDAQRPLTHTLAYSAEGLLEMGILLEDERLIKSARLLSVPLAQAVRPDGFLAGRFDANWKPVVSWSCLTGQCQMAIVWQRLAGLQNEPEMADAARRCLEYAKSVQSADEKNPNVCGAIPGSSPITGDYTRLRFPNWAAKFFLDALLLSIRGGVAAEPAVAGASR